VGEREGGEGKEREGGGGSKEGLESTKPRPGLGAGRYGRGAASVAARSASLRPRTWGRGSTVWAWEVRCTPARIRGTESMRKALCTDRGNSSRSAFRVYCSRRRRRGANALRARARVAVDSLLPSRSAPPRRFGKARAFTLSLSPSPLSISLSVSPSLRLSPSLSVSLPSL
jgi:hypothetical protein